MSAARLLRLRRQLAGLAGGSTSEVAASSQRSIPVPPMKPLESPVTEYHGYLLTGAQYRHSLILLTLLSVLVLLMYLPAISSDEISIEHSIDCVYNIFPGVRMCRSNAKQYSQVVSLY